MSSDFAKGFIAGFYKGNEVSEDYYQRKHDKNWRYSTWALDYVDQAEKEWLESKDWLKTFSSKGE